MDEEMNSLHTYKTWTRVKRLENQKQVECKWLFKLKDRVNLTDPPMYKERLVEKDYTQKEDIDFTEIFSHVVKFENHKYDIVCSCI